ncbi:MAG: DinB family protein [Acidimicrobiia bacterium]
MKVGDVYLELYGRIPSLVRAAVDGLDHAALVKSPGPGANPVGWLVWHLTRVQDHHVSELLAGDQLWTGGGWAARFGRDAAPNDVGFGHTAEQVALFDPVGAALLVEYHEAVDARTRDYLGTLIDADLDRIVDRRWDPPVTLGVRLVSVADDSLQHGGQALYARGIVDTGWRFPA